MDGLRIGVTGARKAQQLADALARRGADPVLGPLVTTDVPVPEAELVAVSDEVMASPPAWFAASTGTGMKLWAEVCERHGRHAEVRAALDRARRVARGAKAVGGLAAFDLRPEHVTDEETDHAVVAWLTDRVEPGERVVVQVHGTDDGSYTPLSDRGAEVVTVRPYVAGRKPEDEERARSLVRAVAEGALDVITFTSPGAARNLFELAHDMGDEVSAGVDAALGSTVAVAVIGPVTGAVLDERGVSIAIAPERHRQGELVRAIERWAEGR